MVLTAFEIGKTLCVGLWVIAVSETGVRVFIPFHFPSHSEGPGDWSDAAGEYVRGPRWEFRRELEDEYGGHFEITSIGTGAAFPAYVLELVSDPYKLAATLFFAGQAIKSGFEGWSWVYARLSTFFHRSPTFDREGAAFLVYQAIVDRMGGVPKSFELKGFVIQNRLAYPDPSKLPPDPGPLETIEPPPERVQRAHIYIFDAIADGREFRVQVDGHKVNFLLG